MAFKEVIKFLNSIGYDGKYTDADEDIYIINIKNGKIQFEIILFSDDGGWYPEGFIGAEYIDLIDKWRDAYFRCKFPNSRRTRNDLEKALEAMKNQNHYKRSKQGLEFSSNYTYGRVN